MNDTLYRKIFLGLMAFVFVLMPLLGLKGSINADEKFQVFIARYIVPFYTSFGKDQRVLITKDEAQKVGNDKERKEKLGIDMLPMENNLMNYGGGFEFVSAVFNNILGNKTDKDLGFHTVRHVLLGLIAAFIMLLAGLTAKELIGWRAAVLAVIFLLISPRFTGHGIMNTKDIPFALGYIFAVWATIRFLRALPAPTWKDAAWVVAGLAVALSIRVGALLLFIYFSMFCVLFWLYYSRVKSLGSFGTDKLKAAVGKSVVVLVAGYFLGLILWPYGILAPLSHPLEVLQEQSKFPVFINQLFEGQVVSSKDLPWYYLPKFIGMTSPIVVLLGLGLLVGLFYKNKDKVHPGLLAFVAFVVIFPLAYIGYTRANVYNGWRHVIFVYPPLAVMAALGFEFLWQTLKGKAAYAIPVAIAVLSVMPVLYTFSNVPYQYTYFNPLVGGIKGANGYYVTDYYMIGVQEASKWLLNEEKIGSKDKKLVIATDTHYPAWVYLNAGADNVDVKYTRFYDRYEKGWDWDYGIFYSEFVDPYQLQKGNWPPENTVYTVEAGGVPIVAVVKNKDNSSGVEAMKLFQAQKYAEAIPLFLKAISNDSKSHRLYFGLGMSYLQLGKYNEAKQMLGNAVVLMPKSKNYSAMYYYYLAFACIQGQPADLSAASSYLNKALELNPGFNEAKQLLQRITSAGGGSPSF